MLKQLLDLTAKLFSLSRDVQQDKADIKDLQREVRDLARGMARGIERLAYEIRRVSDNEVQERKMMALQLENNLLKFERRLPSSKDES